MDDIFPKKNHGIPWVGFNLDGTLATFSYDKWQENKNYIGEPVPKMAELVKYHLSQGTVVKIFTARAEFEENIGIIHKWLRKVGLPELEVTNRKSHHMVKLYDNSCVQVMTNSGMTYDDILNSIIQPIIGKNRSEILKKMDKLANSSIEGRALAKVLERLFKFMNRQ